MTSTKTTWKKWTMIMPLFAAAMLVCVRAAGQSKSSAPVIPTQPVLVVNGSGQPIPTAAQGTTNVAGTVNIGNAPSVNVANTPTVNLAAGGSVGVTNPPDSQNNPTPLAVLEATQTYYDSCGFDYIGFSSGDDGQCSFRAVPTGKRLVIQEFDAAGHIDPGVKPITIFLGLVGVQHYFPATFMGEQVNTDWFATHQETRLYFEANQTPICEVELSNSTARGHYDCQLSGFLVDVP